MFEKQHSNPHAGTARTKPNIAPAIAESEISPLCCSKASMQRPNAHPCPAPGASHGRRGCGEDPQTDQGAPGPPPGFSFPKQRVRESQKFHQIPQLPPSQGAKLRSPSAPTLRAHTSEIPKTTSLGVGFVCGVFLSFFRPPGAPPDYTGHPKPQKARASPEKSTK